jgi:hypothetical protein
MLDKEIPIGESYKNAFEDFLNVNFKKF